MSSISIQPEGCPNVYKFSLQQVVWIEQEQVVAFWFPCLGHRTCVDSCLDLIITVTGTVVTLAWSCYKS